VQHDLMSLAGLGPHEDLRKSGYRNAEAECLTRQRRAVKTALKAAEHKKLSVPEWGRF
jgi:hypothetical protein